MIAQMFQIWIRASEELDVLFDARCYGAAVGKSYWPVFHAAKAALYSRGISAKSHGAVKILFGKHIVCNGLMEQNRGRLIGHTCDLRILADHHMEKIFEKQDAEPARIDAQCSVGRVAEMLEVRFPCASWNTRSRSS